MYTKKAHIHFVGIGGIGMSGIAHIIRRQGYTVSGCDQDIHKKSVLNLKDIGCVIHEGNNTRQCHDATIDILVYSSAIQMDNPEIVAAQLRGIPTISRALMLAELMRTKYSIAIAGSHGKTTTTSLISHILIESALDPTVIIGGHLINISTNARMGLGDFLVAEADESDRSFLHLQATLALVTNINLEHLDTYKNLDDIKDTYIRFLNNLPFYGKAFMCIDDPNIRSVLPIPHLKVIKYGLNPDAEISAQNITLHANHSTFNVTQRGNTLGQVTLSMLGEHNVQNCLGALAVCLDIGIPFEKISSAIESFKGIERRFWFRGTYKGAEIFDDYAVHPHEIEQTLKVAHRRAKKKLTVIWEPHRYTRAFHLWHDFLQLFATQNIDTLIITDIYAASEKPIQNITGAQFVQALQKLNPHMNVQYTAYDKEFNNIKQAISEISQPEDLLLLLGAGKLTNLPDKLCTGQN
jgi:UDP-N-acetylmuramate--alanine ligase